MARSCVIHHPDAPSANRNRFVKSQRPPGETSAGAFFYLVKIMLAIVDYGRLYQQHESLPPRSRSRALRAGRLSRRPV